MASPTPSRSLRPDRAQIIAVGAVALSSVVLLAFARQFDFVCDDAFITLRYSRNLATYGSPVYNIGERVEGYTNFLWMVLNAVTFKLGVGPIAGVKFWGGLSGIFALASTWALFVRVEPKRPVAGLFVVVALAISAPMAAWTLGGLETPLFAALATLGLALGADVAADAAPRRALVAGAVLALATLTRPEGALVCAVVALVTLVARVRKRDGRIVWAALIGGYLAIVVPFVAWRWHYYGYPLPNTFYLKVSTLGDLLIRRGGGYLLLALLELGWAFVGLIALALLVPARRARSGESAAEGRRRRAVIWMARLFVPPFVLYVLRVGGDFLDLYRFFVPLLPIALVTLTAASICLVAPWLDRRGMRVALGLAGAVFLLLHGITQSRTASRAMIIDEPARIERAIEPLGWTRLYERRWAAIGRWVARHARPGEWMAAGAAGATPYYAGINNLDTLGLCDTFVSHQGDAMGDRPGHQRFAPHGYILSKHPVFVFLGDRIIGDEHLRVPRDAMWEHDGYRWVQVRADETLGAPEPFFFLVIVRTDRLEEVDADPLTQSE